MNSEEFKKAISEAAVKYVRENRVVKEGDLVYSIPTSYTERKPYIISSVSIDFYEYGKPCLLYYGILATKKLKAAKNRNPVRLDHFTYGEKEYHADNYYSIVDFGSQYGLDCIFSYSCELKQMDKKMEEAIEETDEEKIKHLFSIWGIHDVEFERETRCFRVKFREWHTDSFYHSAVLRVRGEVIEIHSGISDWKPLDSGILFRRMYDEMLERFKTLENVPDNDSISNDCNQVNGGME